MCGPSALVRNAAAGTNQSSCPTRQLLQHSANSPWKDSGRGEGAVAAPHSKARLPSSQCTGNSIVVLFIKASAGCGHHP